MRNLTSFSRCLQSADRTGTLPSVPKLKELKQFSLIVFFLWAIAWKFCMLLLRIRRQGGSAFILQFNVSRTEVVFGVLKMEQREQAVDITVRWTRFLGMRQDNSEKVAVNVVLDRVETISECYLIRNTLHR